MMGQRWLQLIVRFFSSLQLTVVLLISLGVVVFFMTMYQVETGIYVANQRYFGEWLIWWESPIGRLPVFVGGGVLGGLLVINLMVAHFTRFKWTRKKIGLWLTHIGLLILLIGSGITAILSIESQMMIQEGQTISYSEHLRTMELGVETDHSPTMNRLVSFPNARLVQGSTLTQSSLPFSIQLYRVYPNSRIELNAAVGESLPKATQGLGKPMTVFPMPVILRDDYRNQMAIMADVYHRGRMMGRWLLSNGLDAPQSVTVNGVSYRLFLRAKREYHPYQVRLDRFTQEYYPDTTIPKHFASAVTVTDESGQSHPATIYMNHPLRFGGNTHYQASFGQDGTSTVLQVVSNPGWWVPYVSTLIMTVGLFIHFGMSLIQARKGRG